MDIMSVTTQNSVHLKTNRPSKPLKPLLTKGSTCLHHS
jgi:hypothetical protein